MIRLHCSEEYPVGAIVDVGIDGGDEVETCCYLSQHPVLYPQAVDGGWGRRSTLRLLPSAPGRYLCRVAWRNAGRSGGERVEFRVLEPRLGRWRRLRRLVGSLVRSLRQARRLPIVELGRAGGGVLVGPSTFEVSLISHLLLESELEAIRDLETTVRPGDVVYDVGANLGLYSIAMSRFAGPGGRVLCFEPNPVCVSYLRLNVELNGLDQVEIVPVALLDHEGDTGFMVDFGNASLGTGADSGFFGYKTGQEIRVPCAPLDHLVERLDLPPPDFVKIDVEGAEHRVIKGMPRLLSEHHPRLLLELHGEGAVEDTLGELVGYAYRFRVPGQAGSFADARSLLDAHGARVLQVVAEPTKQEAAMGNETGV